jgi:hypothetical protein
MGLKVPEPDKPVKRKRTVMFAADTIDKNVDADDLFSQANQDRSDYASRMTYGGTDAMMTERTGTIHKSKVMTEEQKRAAIMGPAAKAKAKMAEFKLKKEVKGKIKEAISEKMSDA